jgi:hypothetical protein
LNEENIEEEEDKDDLMSDYVDENFENDETDEFWDRERLPVHEMHPRLNDLNIITEVCLPLKDNLDLKRFANYQYIN